MRYIILALLLFISGCGLQPDNAQLVDRRYEYGVRITVDGKNSYYDMCDLVYRFQFPHTDKVFRSASSVTENLIKFTDPTNANPILLLYTDDGSTPEKKFLGLIKAPTNSYILTVNMKPIGNTAVFAGVGGIRIDWTWRTTYSDIRFIVKGYDTSSNTLSTLHVNPADGYTYIQSDGRYDIFINVSGKTNYLTGGNAI